MKPVIFYVVRNNQGVEIGKYKNKDDASTEATLYEQVTGNTATITEQVLLQEFK